jgi:hypothetical protein
MYIVDSDLEHVVETGGHAQVAAMAPWSQGPRWRFIAVDPQKEGTLAPAPWECNQSRGMIHMTASDKQTHDNKHDLGAGGGNSTFL